MSPCSRCGAPTNSDGSCTQGACRGFVVDPPPQPGAVRGPVGNRKLAEDILEHVAKLPELQAFFTALPSTAAVSGFEREQGAWLRLLGHLPTYSLICAIEDMIWDALPDVMLDLVRAARDT